MLKFSSAAERTSFSLSTIASNNDIQSRIIVREKLLSGELDKDIFGPSPRVTEDINHILSDPILSSVFVDRIFIKCDSAETIRFWFDNTDIKVRHPINLALNLQSNLAVFKFLKEHGAFNNFTNNKKERVINIAKSLQLAPDVLNFLKEIPCVNSKPSI